MWNFLKEINESISDVLDDLDKAKEKDEVDAVTFGLETDDGNIIKVYVQADQADKFEEELSQAFGKEDDIEKVLNELAGKYNIIEVVWPDADKNAGPDEDEEDEDDLSVDLSDGSESQTEFADEKKDAASKIKKEGVEESSTAQYLAKLAKVIQSCKTLDQLATAEKFSTLVFNKVKGMIRDRSGMQGIENVMRTLRAIETDIRNKKRELKAVKESVDPSDKKFYAMLDKLKKEMAEFLAEEKVDSVGTRFAAKYLNEAEAKKTPVPGAGKGTGKEETEDDDITIDETIIRFSNTNQRLVYDLIQLLGIDASIIKARRLPFIKIIRNSALKVQHDTRMRNLLTRLRTEMEAGGLKEAAEAVAPEVLTKTMEAQLTTVYSKRIKEILIYLGVTADEFKYMWAKTRRTILDLARSMNNAPRTRYLINQIYSRITQEEIEDEEAESKKKK